MRRSTAACGAADAEDHHLCPTTSVRGGFILRWFATTLAAVTPALGILGLAALLGAALPDPADDRGWRLAWRAPAGCPDAASVERRVASVLGAPDPAASLRVSVDVKRDGDGWTLDLVARRAEGRQRRRLHHRDCATLVEATLLLVALAVDPATVVDPRLAAALRSAQRPAVRRPQPAPGARVEPVARARAPEAEVPASEVDAAAAAPALPVDVPASAVDAAAAAPALPVDVPVRPPVVPPAPQPRVRPAPSSVLAPAAAPAPRSTASPTPPSAVPPVSPRIPPSAAAAAPLTPAPPARRRPAVALRGGGGAAGGATPAVSGGPVGAVTLVPDPRARIELTGSYWAPRRAHLAGAAGPAADISLVTGGVRGCGVVGRGRFELPLCLGVELGSMRATGVEVTGARRVRSLWLALTPGVAAVYAVRPRFAVWLGLDGLLALARPQFFIEGGGEVHRAGRVGVRGWLALEVRFSPPLSPRP